MTWAPQAAAINGNHHNAARSISAAPTEPKQPTPDHENVRQPLPRTSKDKASIMFGCQTFIAQIFHASHDQKVVVELSMKGLELETGWSGARNPSNHQ